MFHFLALFLLGIHLTSAQNLPLPPLPYEYNALEPALDVATMKVHHLGHHSAYTKQLNLALEQMRGDPKWKHLSKMGVDELLKHLDQVPDEFRDTVRNAGGGYVNHDLFWKILSPWGGQHPTGESDTIQERHLADVIQRDFGSFEGLQGRFNATAMGLFGSGWAWLTYNQGAQKLEVTATAGHDTPAMQAGQTPILLLDLWEHAYYLQYQNRRDKYVAAFWRLVNWGEVATRYALATGEVTPEALPSPDKQEKSRVGLVAVDEASMKVTEL